MTRTELLTHLATLTPAQRRTMLAMAKTIRVAREHGDTRPAAEIVAHLVQPSRRVVLH
jgi:hypothetical protein